MDRYGNAANNAAGEVTFKLFDRGRMVKVMALVWLRYLTKAAMQRKSFFYCNGTILQNFAGGAARFSTKVAVYYRKNNICIHYASYWR